MISGLVPRTIAILSIFLFNESHYRKHSNTNPGVLDHHNCIFSDVAHAAYSKACVISSSSSSG